jgi:hypothetical protein
MRADIIPVSKFPDYELSDRNGKRRKLSELQAGSLGNAGKQKLTNLSFFLGS